MILLPNFNKISILIFTSLFLSILSTWFLHVSIFFQVPTTPTFQGFISIKTCLALMIYYVTDQWWVCCRIHLTQDYSSAPWVFSLGILANAETIIRGMPVFVLLGVLITHNIYLRKICHVTLQEFYL